MRNNNKLLVMKGIEPQQYMPLYRCHLDTWTFEQPAIARLSYTFSFVGHA